MDLKTNLFSGNYRWTICALLFFATTINYLDRQVLSLLAPSLSLEFHWTNSDYANITAIFQLVYAVSMLFAGRLIDSMGTKRGFTACIIVWSLGAIMHAFAIPIGTAISSMMINIGMVAVPVSITGFILSRAVLGFGESGNFPAAIKATAEYFPKRERSLATGIFNSGSNIGAIMAPLTIPYIAFTWGWEATFVIIGAIGFVWLVFWYIFYDSPKKQKRLSEAEYLYITVGEADKTTGSENSAQVSWFKLLGYRQTWLFILGKFMTDGVWWFFLFWLPKYLEAQFGMVKTEIVLPIAVLYSMTMIGSIGGGWFPTYFINKGYNSYEGRIRAMFIIALFPLSVLLAQPLGHISFWIPIVVIGIGASAHQAWSANMYTTVSDLFPKNAVGSVVGIGGMAGGISGVLITKLSGTLFDYYESIGSIQTGYTIVFVFCAIAYLAAWRIMKLLVPVYNPVTTL